MHTKANMNRMKTNFELRQTELIDACEENKKLRKKVETINHQIVSTGDIVIVISLTIT